MMPMIQQVGASLLGVICGWVVLWPLRRTVGAVSYHLWALPVGLLAFTLAGAVASVTARPLDAVSLVAGTLVLVLVVRGTLLWCRGQTVHGVESDERPGWQGHALVMALLLVAGAVFAVAKFTVATNDALVGYWPMALSLARGDGVSASMISSRGVLIPAMGAVHAHLGAAWAYVIYPLLAVNLLVVVAAVAWRRTRSLGVRRLRWAVAVGAVVFLAVEPAFLFHAFFVHSHMVSALYILLATIALVRADAEQPSGHGRTAWLILAGLATAGFTHARPDGIAYAFVLVAAALAVITRPESRERLSGAYFAPLLAVVGLVYAAAYATLGLWPAVKLNGTTALGVLSLLGLTAMVPSVVRLLAERTGLDLRGGRMLSTAVAIVALALLAVVALRTDSALLAFGNAARNLLGGEGGYGPLWYVVLGLLMLSVASGDALRVRSDSRFVFLTIVLFFLTAGVVHAASHPGRLGDLDSFTRIAFHVLPLVVLYAVMLVTRITGDRLSGSGSLENGHGRADANTTGA